MGVGGVGRVGVEESSSSADCSGADAGCKGGGGSSEGPHSSNVKCEGKKAGEIEIARSGQDAVQDAVVYEGRLRMSGAECEGGGESVDGGGERGSEAKEGGQVGVGQVIKSPQQVTMQALVGERLERADSECLNSKEKAGEREGASSSGGCSSGHDGSASQHGGGGGRQDGDTEGGKAKYGDGEEASDCDGQDACFQGAHTDGEGPSNTQVARRGGRRGVGVDQVLGHLARDPQGYGRGGGHSGGLIQGVMFLNK